MADMITSDANAIIKTIKSLYKKKQRWENSFFIIEGIKLIREAIENTAKIKYIVYSDLLFSCKEGEKFFSSYLEKKEHKVYYISDKLMNSISDTETPQGLIAVVSFLNCSLESIMKQKGNFFVILDRLQDPGNVGTIIRAADALGSNGVISTEGCVDIYNPKTIRATMGSIFHIPILYYDDGIKNLINELKKREISIMSTSLDAKNLSYQADFIRDFALIIGNESSGVSSEILDISDVLVRIPMEGKAESLNAAVAASIVMYEALRQRKIQG